MYCFTHNDNILTHHVIYIYIYTFTYTMNTNHITQMLYIDICIIVLQQLYRFTTCPPNAPNEPSGLPMAPNETPK